MAHLDLLRTVHCPVTADGSLIKNSFGVVIATLKANDPSQAAALAQLINLGAVEAKRLQHEHEQRESKLAKIVFKEEQSS